MTEAERLKMFNENQALVPYSIKGKWFSNIIEKDDLMQEGYLTLWKCTDTFDASLGVTFATYACNQLFYALSNYANKYRLGSLHASTYSEAISAASCAYNENRNIHDVCEERKLTKAQCEVAYLISNGASAFVSLNTTIGRNNYDTDREIGELIPDDIDVEEDALSKVYNDDLVARVYSEFAGNYEKRYKSVNPELNQKMLKIFLDNIFKDRISLLEASIECGVSINVVRVRFEKFRKRLRVWFLKEYKRT